MFIMDYFGRQNFGQLYGGNFRPSWLPRRHYQPDHPPVLVVQIPVPVTWRNNCFAHDNLKSKSRAQRLRDFKRRQTFQEKKSICTMMPFYGLEEQELTNEIRSGSEDQGSKFSSKLRKATKTVKILEIENQALLSSKAELGASIVEEKQRCQELSTQLEAALKTVENLTSYKQDYFDAEVRWSNELEKVQCLEQKVQQQAKMLEDYHDAEMRWSAENEKIQFLEQQVRQMWDNVMKPDSRHAEGPTCPYGYMDCSGPVPQNNPDTMATGNQEIPVINSVFRVNSTTSKHKPRRKGRRK